MATTKTQQDIIKKFMYYLDNTVYSGAAAVNGAVNYATGGYFKNFSAAINKMVADCKKTNDADTFLKKYCGIILDNTDTGAITGKDAGGSKIKTAKSIVPESGSLDTSFKETSFTTNGVTFRLSKTSLKSNEKYIWQALKTWWAAAGLKLLKQSYGYSFNDADATVKEITVVFKNDTKAKYLAYTDYPQEINGHYSLVLNINTACYSSFKSGDVNGATSNDPSYLDRTLAHELTHAIMMAKVEAYDKLPRFITEGLAELTHGIDDLRTTAIKRLGKDYEKLKTYVNLSATAGNVYTYAGGYMFLRYLAKQGAANYLSDVNTWEDFGLITIEGTSLTVSKNFPEETLDLKKYSAIEKVDASARTKAIKIIGNSLDNSIVGGKGNDTLTGGKGSDVFVYTAGKDVITDYSASDKISLGAAISKTTLDGKNVVFKIGKGSLTINNAKGKTLNLIDSTGKKYSTVVGGTTLTLTNAATSSVTVDSAIKILNASSRTTSIKIKGNALDNTIRGGSANDKIYGKAGNDKIYGGAGNDKLYGGKGNDTLIGGAGNDSLWGGTGADNFIYSAGDGDDIIFGFGDNDTLTFDALDFKASHKNDAMIFKVSGGSVTLKNFSATTFHINDYTYQIKGSKIIKQS